jgi:hypothetical protein
VTLRIKTHGSAGEKITQTGIVYTNDPEKPKIPITLTGQVMAAADIDPKAARLVGKAGESIDASIRITPPAINRFDITDAKAQDGTNISFRLEKNADQAGGGFVLHIANTKPDPGRYGDRIILKTTSSISPELQIRVFGIIRE